MLDGFASPLAVASAPSVSKPPPPPFTSRAAARAASRARDGAEKPRVTSARARRAVLDRERDDGVEPLVGPERRRDLVEAARVRARAARSRAHRSSSPTRPPHNASVRPGADEQHVGLGRRNGRRGRAACGLVRAAAELVGRGARARRARRAAARSRRSPCGPAAACRSRSTCRRGGDRRAVKGARASGRAARSGRARGGARAASRRTRTWRSRVAAHGASELEPSMPASRASPSVRAVMNCARTEFADEKRNHRPSAAYRATSGRGARRS